MAVEFRTTCPYCGESNDLVSSVEPGRLPDGNDSVSVCWQCGGVGIFVSSPLGLGLREPTPEEIVEINNDPLCVETISIVRAALRVGMPVGEAIAEMRRRRA